MEPHSTNTKSGSVERNMDTRDKAQDNSIRRYLHGWYIWFRMFHKARTKRRGAGKQRWLHAYRGAACARWLADGQMRGAKPPRYLRS